MDQTDYKKSDVECDGIGRKRRGLTPLVALWEEPQSSNSRVRVGANTLLDSWGGRTIGERREEGAIMIEAVAYKQLLFTRHVQDMVGRIESFPAAPEFLLRKVSITPPPSRPVARLTNNVQSDGLPRSVLEGQTHFSVVAPYVRSRRFSRSQKRTISLSCESTIDPRWTQRGDTVYPMTQSDLDSIYSVTKVKESEEIVVILFCAAGWRDDITLPADITLVALGPDGEWFWKHSILNRGIADYLDTIFDVDCHEERVLATVETVFRQPGINFPLSAEKLSHVEDIPIHLVVESFRRIAKKEGGLVVYFDPLRADWVLDIR